MKAMRQAPGGFSAGGSRSAKPSELAWVLTQKSMFTFSWYTYAPSAVEATIIAGTFAQVALLMLLFAKVLPLIPLYDIKEGNILKTQIQVGRRTVPATFRED